MNATGKRRLLKLADFLETADIGERQFEMSSWSSGIDRDVGRKLGDCGTAACAFGWATTIPSFRRAGLHFNIWGNPVMRGGRSTSAAAQELFDITDDEANELFTPVDSHMLRGTRGRKTVAKRIRTVVSRYAAPANTTRPAR